MNYKGKVAVITGAGRGIGEKVALTLAEQGFGLALVGRNADNLRKVSEQCQNYGTKIKIFPFDLTNIESISSLIQSITSEFQNIDVLVNNAGTYAKGDPFKSDLNDWDYALNLNFRSVYHLTNGLLTSISPSGGSIINVSSIAGLITYKGGEIYTATKHALKAYSNCLYESVREKNIKVTCLFPGFVNTDFGREDHLIPEKMIQPEDIARTVLWAIEAPLTACPTEITIRPQFSPYK